jgi:hypothetical protein
MVSPIALLKTPSALDLATALVHPGGAREYIFPDAAALAQEVAEREQMVRARVAYDASQAREAEIAELRNEILADGDTGGLVDAWLAEARYKAENANDKRVLTPDAAELVRATKLELETLQGEVRVEIDRWLQYDEARPATRPDARVGAQDRLRAIINGGASGRSCRAGRCRTGSRGPRRAVSSPAVHWCPCAPARSARRVRAGASGY